MLAKILKRERYSTGANLNLLIQDAPEVLDAIMELPDEVDLTIKKLARKRSKNANDLFWEIVGKIADKLRTSKEEVYFELLKKYGQSITITVKEGVDLGRLYKYYERFKDGLSNGTKFVAYRVFIGSSQYTTEEMSVLIDGARQEAQELGIQLELF
jgi:phosphate uptake regulator